VGKDGEVRYCKRDINATVLLISREKEKNHEEEFIGIKELSKTLQ